jgi:hypothetical protein
MVFCVLIRVFSSLDSVLLVFREYWGVLLGVPMEIVGVPSPGEGVLVGVLVF